MAIPTSEEKAMLFPTWRNTGEKTASFVFQPWAWDVSEERIAEIKKLAKPARKAHMSEVKTDWSVYSSIKGVNWYHPISGENPPAYVLGLVIDYDVPLAQEFIMSACQQRAALGGMCPNYIETSLSGNCRCIWLFESPISVHSKEFCDRFLERVASFVEAESFLPGMDRKSLDCEMRWTNGGYWQILEFAKPLPTLVVSGIAIKLSATMATRRGDVPLEKLAEAFLREFPRFKLFNDGVLELGKIGIRFWESGADNPNGAQVIDKGFYCVTGATPIVTWGELLGHKFVESLKAENYGAAAENIFTDGKTYWVRSKTGFVNYDRNDILLRISAGGFDRGREKNQLLSAAERVLVYIQSDKRVDGAVPVLFRPEGIIEYQDSRVLNISNKKPMAPSDKADANPDDFPWLWSFFNGIFADSEECLDHWWAWWRRFYVSSLEMKPLSGQAVFICGPKGCGKNFITELVVPMSMGGRAPNPYKFLMGDTDFSDDILSAPVLAINDEDAPPEHKRTIFEQKVKSMVANNEQTFHPKFMKRTRVEWCGRLLGSLNDGPKDVGMLPVLNPNTIDKVMFFLARANDHQFFEKYKNREMVERELPFLLRWLMSSYQPPERVIVRDRFGVASYHHPHLVNVNRQEQVSYNMLELLVAWMNRPSWAKGVDEVTITPTTLLQQMTMDESLEQLLKDWNPGKMSKALGDLARAQTPGITLDASGHGRNYLINKPKVLATVAGNSIPPDVSQLDLPEDPGEEPHE